MPDGPTGCSRILGHASCGNWSGGFWAAGRSEIPGAGCSGKKRRPAPVTGEITRGRGQSRARVAPPPHRAPRGEPANEASSALAPRTGNRKSFPSGAVLGATLQVRSSRCTGSQCRRRGSASGTPARAPEYAVRQGVSGFLPRGESPGKEHCIEARTRPPEGSRMEDRTDTLRFGRDCEATDLWERCWESRVWKMAGSPESG